MAKSGLGRGLSSLIPTKNLKTSSVPEKTLVSSPHLKTAESVAHVPIKKITPNPHQPRTHFPDWNDKELQESIKQHGILQPLIVTRLDDDSYQLIAGERRFRAATALGMPTVPVIIRKASELEKLELALIENIQRHDLNAIEEAVAYRKLIDEFSLTQELVAKKMGKSRSQVANRLRFLSLPSEIQASLASGSLSEGHAKVILGLRSEQDQMNFFRKIQKQNFSVRDTEVELKKIHIPSYSRSSGQDPVISAHMQTLRQFLGTKVDIQKKGETGKIVIEFYSSEELTELVKKLSGKD